MSSTVISAMHYDPRARILTLAYRHRRGTYRYFDVPQEEYAALCAAPSKSTYLNTIFKANDYRYERVR